MTITAKDLARELSLSQPTVSRILNGDSRHRSSAETRQRVIETAERLGYQPNAVARSLRHGRTGIIGLHTGHNYDARNDFLGAVIGGLQRACQRNHLDLLLHSSIGGSAQEMFGRLRDGRIDGLILHSNQEDELVGLLSRCRLPVVAVADAPPGLPTVGCDDADGMRQLINHLWQRGHRRFAFLTPAIKLPSIEKRRTTFEWELASRGLAAADRTVLEVDFENPSPATNTLLAGQPVVACCWNDRTAYNLLRACLEMGVRVPEEVAVSGFDGFQDDKLPARQLTTVDCSWDTVAAHALEVLTQLMESQEEGSIQSEGRIDQHSMPVRLSPATRLSRRQSIFKEFLR